MMNYLLIILSIFFNLSIIIAQDTIFVEKKVVYPDDANYWGSYRKYSLEQINIDKNQTLFEYVNYYKAKRYVNGEFTKLYTLNDSTLSIKSKRNTEIWKYKKIDDDFYKIENKYIVGYVESLVPLIKEGFFNVLNCKKDTLGVIVYKQDKYIEYSPPMPTLFTQIYNVDSVDVLPEYPGGKLALNKDINEYISTHKPIIENEINGKIFFVVFIDETGELIIKYPVSIANNPDTEQCIFALLSLKKFKPAEKNGKKVVVEMELPININIFK